MAVDISRVLLAAVEAALGEKTPAKKGLSTGRALAIGAGLVVVGRAVAGPGGRFVRDKVQERMANDSESEDAEDEEIDVEPEAEVEPDEVPEAELDEEEEPEAELEQEEEPEADVQEDDASRPSTTRPRPPIFDRPGPRGPGRPSRRPSRPKGDSDQKQKLSAPRRPRRPRAPTGRP